jgi:hypothetical protein
MASINPENFTEKTLKFINAAIELAKSNGNAQLVLDRFIA